MKLPKLDLEGGWGNARVPYKAIALGFAIFIGFGIGGTFGFLIVALSIGVSIVFFSRFYSQKDEEGRKKVKKDTRFLLFAFLISILYGIWVNREYLF